MKARSLRLRLAVAAGISLVLALLLAGIGLTALFERHVVRRVNDELETYVRQLAASVAIAGDDTLEAARPLADPRFSEPLSGLYWQIEDDATGGKLRSRSLWDHVLVLPADPLEVGVVHRHRLAGPAQAMLLVAERRILVSNGAVQHRLRIAAAVDEKEVRDARSAFASDLAKSLLLLAAILLAAAWIQITIGLKPLETLRRSVAAVRSGAGSRLAIQGPEEVMPLVTEVNALLDEKARSIEGARGRAADLAHGLKTPLTVLMTDADRLKQSGQMQIGEEIEDIVVGMRRHIDRELSRARLQARALRTAATASVHEVCARLVKVLCRGPQRDKHAWHIDVPPDAVVALESDDLAELLGAILENAAKWARSEIQITAAGGNRVHIRIEDDGPGVPVPLLEKIGRRGVRLDEKAEGSGLGLAIATDIAEAYGGAIAFEARERGGLAVAVTLPAPADTSATN